MTRPPVTPPAAGEAPASLRRRAGVLLDRYQRPLAFVLGFVALLWFLWPITRTAFLADDSLIAYDADAVAQEGRSVLGYVNDQVEVALDSLGRFAPLPTYVVTGAYYVAPSPFAFKVGLLLLVLLVVALASVLARQLGLAWPYAALIPVVLCATIQLRYWHDPLLAYSGVMPALTAIVLGSYVTFAASLRRRSWPWLGVSLLLFVGALLWYEGTAAYLLGYVPIAWVVARPRLRGLVVAVLPFAVVAFVSVVVLFALRAGVDQSANTTATLYQPSLAPKGFGEGVAKQISGAIPLSYFTVVAREPGPATFTPENVALPYGAAQLAQDVPRGFVASSSDMVRDSIGGPRGLSVLLLVALAAALALRAAVHTRPDPRTALAVAGVGASLVLAPAFALSASTRWQKETFPGVPYIGVFPEYIGMALLLVACIALLLGALSVRRRVLPWVAVALGVLIVGVTVATNALNQRVITAFGGVEAGVEVATAALRGGALGSRDGLSEVVFSEDVPLSAGFLAVKSGLNLEATSELSRFDGQLVACDDQGALCPQPGARRAFVAHMGADGVPWAASCDVDLERSLAARTAVCTGTVTAAVGGSRDADRRCEDVSLDGAPPGAQALDEGLPVELAETGRRGDTTLCQGTAPAAGLLVRSLLVAPPRDAAIGPLQIIDTYPTSAVAGVRFNDQGTASAIGANATGVTPSTRIVFDGVQLRSQYLGPNGISALVPDELTREPRTVQVELRDGTTRSAPVPFVIASATG